MRSLPLSIAIAASAVLLAACESRGRGHATAAKAGDSALARDLALASDTGVAVDLPGHDTAAVTQAPGIRASSPAVDSLVTAASTRASDADSSASRSAPSADGYVGASCASPATDDQKRCLMDYLAKSDVLLDRYYQALILRLKTEAGVGASAPEPESVQRLRAAQRSWLVFRDDECRKRTHAREGPLWGPVRAQCLAEYSARRAQELQDALAKRGALSTRERTVKAKRQSAHASSHHARKRHR